MPSARPIVIKRDAFAVDKAKDVTPETIQGLLDALERRGVFLMSYGNVAGMNSLLAKSDYREDKTAGSCLYIEAIRWLMPFLQDVVTPGAQGTFNADWPSRALRNLCLEAREWVTPLQAGPPQMGFLPVMLPFTRQELGHGEFVAAMLFAGFACRFDPANDTGCTFSCTVAGGITEAVSRAMLANMCSNNSWDDDEEDTIIDDSSEY